jgi:DNA topoisomerase-2
LEELILDDSVKDEKVRAKQVLSDVSSDFTDKYCKFKIEFPSKEDLDNEFKDLNAFEKKFVLSHTISTSNMNLFNADGVMTKYTNPEDILREYCNYRMVIYQKRKDYMINDLATEIDKISEKIRFITYVNDDSHPLRVRQRRKDQILTQLEEYNFKKFGKRYVKNLFGEDLEEHKESYDYLLNMQIYSLTVERIEKLMKEKEKLEQQLDELKKTTTTQMWNSDLDQLCTKMVTFEKDWSKKYADLLKLPKATNPVQLSKISLKLTGKNIVIGKK